MAKYLPNVAYTWYDGPELKYDFVTTKNVDGSITITRIPLDTFKEVALGFKSSDNRTEKFIITNAYYSNGLDSNLENVRSAIINIIIPTHENT